LDKIWTFRPFFLVMLLLWLKFVFIPILTYVVYLWLWFLAIFDPYLRPPNPMAPLHIFDPLGPNNYIHPLKALVLWSLLQKSLCSVRTFLSIKNKSFQNSKNLNWWNQKWKNNAHFKRLFSHFGFWISILTELCEWNTAGINQHN